MPEDLDFEGWVCPTPLRDTPNIVMGHGGGGAMSAELVDQLFLPALLMGASGSIGSTQNIIPDQFVAVYEAYKAGDVQTAKRLQEQINRLMRILHKYGMEARKVYVRKLGFDCGHYRPPFKPLSDEQAQSFLAEVDALERGAS